MTSTEQFADHDGLPIDSGKAEVLWVHGLLRGLTDSPQAFESRLQKFKNRLQTESLQSRRWTLSRRNVLGIAAAAAAIVIGILAGLHSRPAQASAETLVRRAQEAHKLPVDRCYLVQWDAEPGLELLTRPRETLLWTRGDRFWMSSNGRLIAYGRDERGGFWVARSSTIGIRFEPDEADLPPNLVLTCAVCTMRLETLLGEVLSDFDLRKEQIGQAAGEATHLIRAELKSGHEHSSVKSAQLEIDAATNVVRKVVLWRHEATVTFSLSDTGRLNDDSYKLEGHLEPGAKIYTKSFKPELRRQKLRGE